MSNLVFVSFFFLSPCSFFTLKVTATLIFSLNGERWLIFQMFQPDRLVRCTRNCFVQVTAKLAICRYFSRRWDVARKTYTCKLHRQSVPVLYFQHTYVYTSRTLCDALIPSVICTKEYREEVEIIKSNAMIRKIQERWSFVLLAIRTNQSINYLKKNEIKATNYFNRTSFSNWWLKLRL